MGKNIEIKAKIDDIAALLPVVRDIATSGPQEILQDDTFFPCSSGRLKLRILSEVCGELIFYDRPDKPGPKECSYKIAKISEPHVLRELLANAYGSLGRVRKSRIVYMVGNTRVHLDDVEGLGEFLELEVVLSDSESTEDGTNTANSILAKLGISNDQLIDCAYVDLLERNSFDCNDDQPKSVIPAEAGIHFNLSAKKMDARLRGHDAKVVEQLNQFAGRFGVKED